MRSQIVAFVLALASGMSAAIAATPSDRDIFVSGLYSMDRENALFVLMADELLTVRCGQHPTVDQLKSISTMYLEISAALKIGDVAHARQIVEAVPCRRDRAG